MRGILQDIGYFSRLLAPAACVVPVRRAMRVDANVGLRYE